MEAKGGGIIEINGGSHSGSSGRSTPNTSANNDPLPGKLFVGGLSWQTSCDRLREYFQSYGNITDVLVMKDPLSQRSRGFGFITFSDPASVDNVLKVPVHTLDGKQIDPKHATPKNRPRPVHRTKKIFVGGVSQDTSSDEVRAYFAQFGKVEDVSILMDQQTKRHRGFGFVTFESEDVVETVVDIHFHTIKNKKVECKKAQPKENVNGSQLMGKRLIVGGVPMRVHNPAGVITTAGPLLMAHHAAQAHAHAQVQAQAQAAHAQAAYAANIVAQQNAAFGKVVPYHLAAYRYSPYGISPLAANVAPAPPTTTAQATPMPQMPTQQAVAPGVTGAPAAPGVNGTGVPGAQGVPGMPGVPVNGVTAVPGVNGVPVHAVPGVPGVPGAPGVPPGPYQGYNLGNIDMSSFQGIDWATLYQLGGFQFQ